MGNLDVLDGLNPDDRRRWLALWTSMEERIPFAHPGYVELFAKEGVRPLALVHESDESRVLLPVLMRPVSSEPWGALCGEWDMVTPYGYGGAFFEGGKPPDSFFEDVASFAQSRAAVCLFARLSLFPSRTLPFPGKVTFRYMNIVRRLGGDEASLLASYAHKVRKNVKRARSHRLRVVVDRSGRYLDEFFAIYDETMRRADAEPFYRFSMDFFRRLLDELPSSSFLFHVLSGEAVVASELVLASCTSLYSFLGGTRAEAFAMRPNDLLKHEIILFGGREGYKTFVLGGGYRPDDGIFRYKKAFARDGETPFSTGQMVFLPSRYQELCRRRREWSLAHGRPWRPDPGYFPLYRGELSVPDEGP